MLKKNTLYSGDCLDIMKSIDDKSIDFILCDLPYEVTNSCSWDTIIPFELLWEQYERMIKDNGCIALTACNKFHYQLVMSNLGLYKYEWIWEKTQATGHFNAKKRPMNAHEFVDIFYKRQPTYNPQKTQGHKPVNSYTKYIDTVNKTQVYGKCNKEISGGGETDRYPRSVIKFASDKQTCYLHPTQKPVALFEYLIKTYTDEGDLVLDNCAGSGTTGIACINTNRDYILIEKEEEYCDIIDKRIMEHIEGVDKQNLL
jgi:site-specific DNA-methyltransferase (adenine-specific)